MGKSRKKKNTQRNSTNGSIETKITFSWLNKESKRQAYSSLYGSFLDEGLYGAPEIADVLQEYRVDYNNRPVRESTIRAWVGDNKLKFYPSLAECIEQDRQQFEELLGRPIKKREPLYFGTHMHKFLDENLYEKKIRIEQKIGEDYHVSIESGLEIIFR